MIKFKLVNERAYPPERGTPDSAGFDLRAMTDVRLSTVPKKVPLGVAVQLPPHHAGLLLPRSSLSLKGVTSHVGLIDQDYRGELAAVMWIINSQNQLGHLIEAGDKVAQLVVTQIASSMYSEVVEELDPTMRGEGGFGSTGR